MAVIVIYLWMEMKFLSLNPIMKMSTFKLNFILGSISNGFDAIEFKKVSLKRRVIDYSAD